MANSALYRNNFTPKRCREDGKFTILSGSRVLTYRFDVLFKFKAAEFPRTLSRRTLATDLLQNLFRRAALLIYRRDGD